jgi:hypothetical protein
VAGAFAEGGELVTVALVVVALILIGLAFLAGRADSRLREEDDDIADTERLPERTGRPQFTGLHTPPSRYTAGHPPEPDQPPAP